MRPTPIIIDFEATCLPTAGSWPIEVALGWPDTGDVRAWLIRPDVAWLKDWHWSAASERVHNITRDQLDRDGAAAEIVAAEVAGLLRAAPLVVSDQAGYEEFWLRRLWTTLAPPDRPLIRVRSLLEYLGELLQRPPTTAWELLAADRERISLAKPRTHRAGDDVAHYVELVRYVTTEILDPHDEHSIAPQE